MEEYPITYDQPLSKDRQAARLVNQEQVLPTGPPLRVPDRLMVSEKIYHAQQGRQPTAVERTFTRWLESSEQAYLRDLTVGEEWELLDHGWIKTAIGMIHIINEEGAFRQVQPTAEDSAEASSRTIEIGIGPVKGGVPIVCWVIHAGESLRGSPVPGLELFIRCRKGSARYSLLVVPA